jgi:Right handed beta helix region
MLRRLMPLLLLVVAFDLLPTSPATAAGPTHISGTTYSSNTTWSLDGSPYVVDGNVTIASGATLTIDPGVVVKMNGQFRQLFVNGTLHAVGTADSPITFTSYQDDSVGGDTNGDGSATTGSPGQWYSISVSSGSLNSQLSYVTAQYGGYGSANWNYGALSVSGAVSVDNSTFTKNQDSGILVSAGGVATLTADSISGNGNGVSVNNGQVTISASAIESNSQDGLWFNLPGFSMPAASSVSGSTLTGNSRYGVYIGANGNYPLGSLPHGNGNNIYANNGNGIQLYTLGYPSFKNAAVDWKGNFWGSDVRYTDNAAGCAGVSPYAAGHLTYGSSTNGPIYGGSYLLPPQYQTFCYYDQFSTGPCQFATEPIVGDTAEIDFAQAKDVNDALSCAQGSGGTLDQLGSNFDSVACPDLETGYVVDTGESSSDIAAGYEPMVHSLFDEFNSFGDYYCAYSGTAKISFLKIKWPPIPVCAILIGCIYPQPDNCGADEFSWWPNHGTIQTGDSYRPGYEGQRYLYETMVWNQDRIDHVKGCTDNATYEPDATFDNTDGLHYFGNRRSWASNFPRKYKDTRRDDPPSRPTYTIGNGDMTKLVGGRTYFTLQRMNPGNTATDRGSLYGQVGYRYPFFCYSTLCIFAIRSQPLIPAWDLPVPGYREWSG